MRMSTRGIKLCSDVHYRLILIITLFIFSGCTTFHNPLTGQTEFGFIPISQEIKLGSDLAQTIAERFPLDSNYSQWERINRIGQRLVMQSPRVDIPFEFHVINTNEVNAFAVPGGYVYIFQGLCDMLENDNEIAGVLAHEIGHIAARHSMKRIEKVMGYQLLMSLIFHEEDTRETKQLVDMGFDVLLRGNSRSDEFVADRLGVRYTVQAGYDPAALIQVLQKLQILDARSGQVRVQWLQTHPPYPRRIENIQTEIQRLKSMNRLE